VRYDALYTLPPVSIIVDTVSTVTDQSFRPGLRFAQTARYALLRAPRCGIFGERAFSYSGPAAWNELCQRLHNISNFATFRKRLKAYFFLVFISDNVMSGWTSL